MAWVLLWFEATLRLRINSIKSELIPIRDVSNVEELASVFGCEVGKFPTTDLGLPLGAPFKSKVDWDVVEKRFFKRLPLWKRQYLSKGGRITLPKGILCNLPIYFMSLFVIPKLVAKWPEKLQRDSLWGEGALEKSTSTEYVDDL